MKKLGVPTTEVLHDLYVERNLSMANIATIFNMSVMTVRAWLKNSGIQSRVSTVNMNHELRDTEFSDVQKSLLIGSILGDGNLRIPKRGKNAHFSERHCEAQRMYIEWKNKLLMPFTNKKLYMEPGGEHIISGVKCLTQDSFRLKTISHPYLTDLWKMFYIGNGNKKLPANLERYLNIFVIAVWICDDGSLVWDTNRRTYRIDLHTENFSYVENVSICRMLTTYFKGNTLIIPRNYESGTKFYISLRGKKELHTLCSEMISLIPECMKYKFSTHI